MKKIVACAALALSLFSACGEEIPPMGFKVDLTPKAIRQMPAPLDLDEALAGGPLYVFDVNAPDPTLRAFRQLKRARVGEMLTMMNEELGELGDVIEEMPAYRGTVITFWSKLSEALNPADPEQATLRALALDALQRETVAMVRTTEMYAKLEGLAETIASTKNKEGDKLTNATTLPQFEYTQWALMGLTIDAIAKEFSYSQARAGLFISFIEAHKDRFDKKVRKLANKYEKNIGSQVDEVDESFREALALHMDLMACFESLKAADYAFMMAMLEFTKNSLPDIAKKADAIKTGAMVGEEDKDFAKTGTNFLMTFTDELRNGMKNVEPPPYFQMMGEPVARGLIPPFIGVAHAGVQDMLDKAAWALTSSAKEMGNGLYGIAKGALQSPFDVARKVQTGVGSAISYVNTGVGTKMDWMINRYSYGNARQDEQDQIAHTRAKALVAEAQEKQGAHTMRTGRDYLDSVEKGVGGAAQELISEGLNMGEYIAGKVTPDVVKDAVATNVDAVDWMGKKATGYSIKQVFGRDNASWLGGKITEMTVGMATGFGKGILNLANPDASPMELLEGGIDTLFSVIGGSKALVKGTQVLSGVKAAGRETAEKLVSQAARLELKLEISVLKGASDDLLRAAQGRIMSGGEIAILCDNTRKIIENEMREKVLKDAEKSFGKILRELAGKTRDKMVENMGEVTPGARDFVGKSLDTLGDAGAAIAGGTKADYFDNLAGGQADTLMKEMTKYLLLPDKDAEALKKMTADAARLANLDPDDPKNKEALATIAAALEAKQTEMATVAEKAQAAALEQTELKVKEQLLKEMEKEAGSVLSTPVRATGSFSGKYKGSVSMTLTPGGGRVSGTVTTEFGTATISGQSLPSGTLTADVSGTMSYDWYADGFNATKKTCALGGSMSGNVSNRRASGTYNTSCGGKNAGGNWTASW